MSEQDLDKAAGELLLAIMEEHGCSPQGIEAVGFAVDARTLDIAVTRAEYWLGLLYAPTPTADSLRKLAAYTPL
jgi:hypothetical protein